ncbi:hypothetical protein PMAYCL1PPCAC_02075 [Pristionchus mayeri]|uniref:Uncharacterized protein n=1 Tax=Pristionchus mayeri TaxID=1317129 RepID=A0AAN5C5Y3_9BILA|nr:hypothetical protein PMAYCL1PPCAC_02075 [Pristionchus mayeri]
MDGRRKWYSMYSLQGGGERLGKILLVTDLISVATVHSRSRGVIIKQDIYCNKHTRDDSENPEDDVDAQIDVASRVKKHRQGRANDGQKEHQTLAHRSRSIRPAGCSTCITTNLIIGGNHGATNGIKSMKK